MLKILQQFYIQMESEPHECSVYPGDLSTYTLQCIRCDQPVTLAGWIGETLFHAPAAMLYHWNMIQSHDNQNDQEQFLCHFFSPLMKIIYNHQNLFKKVWTGWRIVKFVKNQQNMDKLCFVRLLMLIWQFPRTHNSTTQ